MLDAFFFKSKFTFFLFGHIMFLILPLLSLFVSCEDLEPEVINLTAPEFRDNVLKRDKTSLWLVLFVGLGQKQCFKAQREFQKAARQVGKIAKFAVVNITEEPIIQRRLYIEYIPYCRVYFPGGSEDYRGKFTASGFVGVVTDKMPNFVRIFDRKWLEESLASVVLFTDQIKVPTIWSILSLEYRNQFIRFGICNEFHIHRELSITRLPTIIFYNSSNQIKYHGEMNEQDLKAAIDSFLNQTLTETHDLDDEGFYRYSEFKSQCTGRDFCVLYTGAEVSDDYRKIQSISKRHQMKFFYGDKNLPFKQLKENTYYIWNPRRKAVIHVAEIQDLSPALDRVIDGGAKWTKVSDLDKSDSGL